MPSRSRGVLLEQIGKAPSAQRLTPALTNTSGVATCPRMASQARSARPPASTTAASAPGVPCRAHGCSSTAGRYRRSSVPSARRRAALPDGHVQHARSRMPSRVAGSGASSTACNSRAEVGHQARIRFLERDRQTRRICSSAAGCRYSRKRKNDLIAASRTLRVTAAFLRSSSRCSRKALTSRHRSAPASAPMV